MSASTLPQPGQYPPCMISHKTCVHGQIYSPLHKICLLKNIVSKLKKEFKKLDEIAITKYQIPC
jgi:hypothetical protein